MLPLPAPKELAAQKKKRRRRGRPTLPIPSFREVSVGHSPGRAMLYSVCAHALATVLIFLVTLAFERMHRFRPAAPPSVAELRQSKDVSYLPQLGGGSTGQGHRGGSSGKAVKVSSGLRAKSRRGFAYPGKQPLVSDPPRSVLGIQTILRPALNNPPVVRHYLPLSDVVRPATPLEPTQIRAALVVKPGRLAIRRPSDKLTSAPRLRLPAASANLLQELTAATSYVPPKPATNVAAPNAPDLAHLDAARKNTGGLLVLNAVPPPPDVSGRVPFVEERSRFAIAPGEATVIAEPASGTQSGGASSAMGNGGVADLPSGDAVAEAASGGGRSGAGVGSGTGSGGRYGNAQGTGLNAAAGTAGAGRGSERGSGAGAGAGIRLGSGGGEGSAVGGGSFPGITIQGGQFRHGGTGNLRTHVASPTSYHLTVEATAGSGGGLPDLGVFQDEKVYTVYIDMRANDEDRTPSWTLQYAVLRRPPDAALSDTYPTAPRGTPTPPLAIFKEIPRPSSQALRNARPTTIIASAIMNAEGRLEQVAIRRGPDAQTVESLIEALNHWMFQPAQIDGKPVALKILLGIFLTPNPQNRSSDP